MQQSISSADFAPLVRKIPYLCFVNPPLRRGSVVTPEMVLDDKLDVFQWELKRGFITSEDLPDEVREFLSSTPPEETGRGKKPAKPRRVSITKQRLSRFRKLAEIPILQSPCHTILSGDNIVAIDGLFNTLRELKRFPR